MSGKPGVVVVVPAHNEVATLQRCIDAIGEAALAAAVPTSVIVVLDACVDESAGLAERFGSSVEFVVVDERSVGRARAAGFRHARAMSDGSPTWYATTDADTQVGRDWLTRQLAADADMVLGVVRVEAWRHHSDEVAAEYESRYAASRHQHIHGANMGFSSRAYWQVGGFSALSSGEDVDLVQRFRAAGYRVHSDESLCVTTSDRCDSRAPGGFSEHLTRVADDVEAS